MTQRPAMTLTATVLGAPDPRALARFYQRLLGWSLGSDEPGWVTLRPPGGGAGLSFQTEEGQPDHPDQDGRRHHAELVGTRPGPNGS